MQLVRTLFGAGVVAAGIALGAASAFAAEVNLKFSYWVPEKHPLNQAGFQPWAESIKAASNGSIEFSFFPSQQLGKAPDHYDMVRDGIADVSFINPGYQPGRFPIIAAGELPFHITNADKGSRALNDWYMPYAEKEMGDIKVCFVYLHDPGAIHSQKKITHPDQIKGMTIRPAHATMARFVSLLGGASVQVPAPDARDALAKGAADAITFPWDSIYSFGIDSVTKHHLDLPLYVTTFVMGINLAAYNAMSDGNKKVIDDHCNSDWAEKVGLGWATVERKGRTKMIDAEDHFVHEASAEEITAWKEAAKPLTEAWKKDAAEKGYEADAIYESFVETLKKNESHYE